jgi:hypothetical protein
MKNLTPLLALMGPGLAAAHSGHGLPGEGHWHATDVWGFVALAVGVGLVIWLQRRK